MVNQSQRGFRDWLIQRISAIIIGTYMAILIGYIISSPDMTYTDWLSFYQSSWIRIDTIATLVAILWHAWIGLWTVFTDYIKPKFLRLFLEVSLFIVLIG